MWWVLGIVGSFCVAWGVFSVRRVLSPEGAPRAWPLPAPAPEHAIHHLTATDGASFAVYRLIPERPRARLLLCHGYSANHTQLLDLAQRLRARGYDTLLFDMRGHGDRPGPCTVGVKETEDALLMLRWARQHDGPQPLPVGLLGLSMGAAVACQVALRNAEVRAVVVDSIYSRFFPVLRRAIARRYHLPAVPFAWITWWMLQGVLGRRLAPRDPVALAPRLHQPLLLIQGGADQRVPPPLGGDVYARWAGPKERWFEPAVVHVGMSAVNPDAYGKRVADFFDRTLIPS
ncbi:MAG: alpha/beta fold hydrolase [Candidatus Omnitrophota bacterium]|nr:alpha/beta fold hydrolase [Candidatus Omnitrophota bacterium]